MAMQEYRLRRDGQIPLVFTGELIRTVTGQLTHGKDSARYHSVSLYRTEASRRYVLAVTFHSSWDGEEPERHDVLLFGPDAQGMIKALRDYNPIPPNIGFPRNPNYAERQAQLEQSLTTRFQTLITTLLENIDGVEERIE